MIDVVIDAITREDKVMAEKIFYERKENYLKLDCYRDENSIYYWK